MVCGTLNSHFLNRCWIIVEVVLWYTPENKFAIAHELYPWHVSGDYTFEITSIYPKDQWITMQYNLLWNIFWKTYQAEDDFMYQKMHYVSF